MTPSLGFALSSEEHSATDLVELAVAAEEAGFEFAMISDHFHPVDPDPGPEPVRLGCPRGDRAPYQPAASRTGVTCPIIRTHPAIIAQRRRPRSRRCCRAASGSASGRARTSTSTSPVPMAARRRPYRDARGGDRGDPRALAGDKVDHRGSLHCRKRDALQPAREPAADPDGGRRTGKRRSPRARPVMGSSRRRPMGSWSGRIGRGRTEGRAAVGQLTVCWAQDEADAKGDRPSLVAKRCAAWRRIAGAGPSRRLRRPRPGRLGRAGRQRGGLRARSGSLPLGHRGLCEGRLRPRLHAPGWPRPGRLHALRDRELLQPVASR